MSPNQLGSISGYVIAAAIIFIGIKSSQPSVLDSIPTVGSTSRLGSWWAGLMYLINAPDVLQEGYRKYKSAPFKVAELYRWIVVLSKREHVDELRRAPDDTLSFDEATSDTLQVNYTMGAHILQNPYHLPIVRLKLTRNIGALCPEIRNEIVTAFDDVLDLRENEWIGVPALSTMQQIVCRASNRVFVGLPLCRDPNWIDLNIRYSIDVIKGATVVKLFPTFFKHIATWLFTNVSRSNQRGRRLLGPIIEERLEYLNEYGNEWTDKPNDFLSWLMEEAEGSELTVESLTSRILVANFAAIHSSSHSFTHALFYLAANPQYIRPLREEVETVVDKEGWTKAALGKMRKVDSFLKECQRLEGIGITSLTRKALKDFTFSDGTFIPKGTTITAAARCVHRDEAFYENPDAFEPFRFADMREEDGEGVKYQFVSTTTEYLPFGHGRHACPGRFFAASQLKFLLAHVVTTYDIKLPDNTTRPQTLHFATALIPDMSAKVMFRKRTD